MMGLGQIGALGRLGSPKLAGGNWWLSESALDLDFANNRAFNRSTGFNGSPNGILTYTSPSQKLVYGNDGVLTYAPHNFIRYSQEFDNATWTKYAVTVAADTDAAPDGTTTADTLTADAGTGIIPRFADVNVITANGAVHTASIYAKAGTYSFVQFYLVNQGAEWVNFTLSGSGTVSANGSCTATITALSGGWYRLTMTYTAGSTDRRPFFVLAPSGTATRAQSWNPAGTESVYFWGAQLNLGPSALTYVPTTSAAVYSLPIDHDPITFEPLGVLIEEQRTNLLTYSEQFDNAAWSKNRASITTNAIAAPDGTTTADFVVEDGTTGEHYVLATYAYTSASHTLSVYAKAGTRSWLRLAENSSGARRTWFNLATGALGTVNAGHTASILPVGNGWYRCSISFTAVAATTTYALISTDIADAGTSYTGDGTSGLYIWGAQLEAGAFATSYIPTVASQVTRAADRISIAQSGYAFNANAGTFGAEYDLIGYVVNYRVVSGGSSYRYFYGPGTVTTLSSYNGSATVTTTVVSPVGNATKVAMSYDGNGRSITDNGNAISGSMTDANAFLTASTTTAIGTDPDGSSPLNGHIKRLTYWNTRKTNAELQALSA